MRFPTALLALLGTCGVAYAQLSTGGGIEGQSPGTPPVGSGAGLFNQSTSWAITGQTTGRTLLQRFANQVNVLDYGAKGDGVNNDNTAIQNAVTTATAQGNGEVYFPCGTYLVNTTPIALPANVTLRGAGWCATLKVGSLLAPRDVCGLFEGGVKAALVVAACSGIANIIVEDLAFDLTAVTSPSGFGSLLQNASNVRFNRLFLNGGASANAGASIDGFAFVHSSNYSITNSTVTDVAGACYDNWSSPTDVVISNNYCDQTLDAGSGTYGVLITGYSGNDNGIAQRVHVMDNIIRGAGQVGIWIQGGFQSGTGFGQDLDVVVTGNTIDTVKQFHGILVSDASRVVVSNNTIRNTQVNGIAIVSQSPGVGTESDITIVNNVVSNCNVGGGGNSCINISAPADDILISENQIVGSAQNYSIVVGSGATNVNIYNNVMDAGTSGRISDSGTNTLILDLVQGINYKGFTVDTTGNVNLHASTPSIVLNAGVNHQASILMENNGSVTWQFGQQVDQSWFLYDSAHNANPIVVDTSGILKAGEVVSLGFDRNGHVRASGTALSASNLSSCGTSPSVTGSDVAGVIQMGTGSPTGCVLTFAVSYNGRPFCTVTWESVLLSMQYAVTSTTLTLVQTGTSSNAVDYQCTAQSGG